MSERRMFAKCITESDAFLDMPLSTQALYFHLGMEADDDGFVGSPKKIIRSINASEDDLKLLITKRFVLGFDTGVIVIKHWKINNYIRGDRKRETSYITEKNLLLENENLSYEYKDREYCLPVDNQMSVTCQSSGSIGKDRIGKDNNKEKKKEKTFDEIIDDFTSNSELRTELKNHLKVRKQKKGALTDRAIELELKKLIDLSGEETTQIEIVRQSIERGWIGFFPVKSNSAQGNTEQRVMEALYGK